MLQLYYSNSCQMQFVNYFTVKKKLQISSYVRNRFIKRKSSFYHRQTRSVSMSDEFELKYVMLCEQCILFIFSFFSPVIVTNFFFSSSNKNDRSSIIPFKCSFCWTSFTYTKISLWKTSLKNWYTSFGTRLYWISRWSCSYKINGKWIYCMFS